MVQKDYIEKENVIRNGVNVTALAENIAAMSENPVLAEFTFRNSNKWIDGSLNRSTVGNFYGVTEEQEHINELKFDNDEPELLLGNDTAPNPVEWILHAVAGCITTTAVYHAAARGIRIDEMSTKLQGDLDLRGLLDIPGAARPGYSNITVDVDIKGDASPQELKELIEFAKSHSPAVDVVSNGTPVVVKVNVSS